MNFDLKATSKKFTKDRILIKLLKTPDSMISASGVSNIIYFSTDPNELCDRLKLLLQENQAGTNSDINN